MRALVTGIRGFVGPHLTRHLLDAGDEVFGISRAGDVSDSLSSKAVVLQGDLCNRADVERVVQASRPEAVYHLAAQASTGTSLVDPWATLSNNLRGQMMLLEVLRASQPKARVLIVGSGDEYGDVPPERLPTSEDTSLRPSSPYATSKAAQDLMGYQYFAQYSMHVVRVRPFSHTGPGHDPRFVVPSFAFQIARAERGLCDPVLRVGNLDVHRDLTDVRDIVRAYRLAVAAGVPGEVYNLGRGEPVRLREVVEQLLELSTVPMRIEVDQARRRSVDIRRQSADVSRFRRLTGWRPEVPWERTLRDTLDYWRRAVSREQVPSGR